VGANADCKPSYLVQFAKMGTVYMEKVNDIDRPRVALFNIGEEASKGNELAQDVYQRLSKSDLHFVGNLEADRVHLGHAEVIVTDGFTGNMAVKTTEGAADFIFRQLRATITAKTRYRLAALVLRPALLAMRKRMDPGTYGGAPLLGVNGVVIVAHGRADEEAIKNGVRLASEAASSGMLDALRGSFSRRAKEPTPASSAETRV
jgi:glycerol-3-phosphate acyltransferase PlsX